MQSYKLSVTKNGKKYTIVFKAENEKMARERVHNEGYSILSIEEITAKEIIGNVFLFTAYNSLGELKNGKIVGDDIFKIYTKLRKNLEYKVVYLYHEFEKDISNEEKDKIIKNLDEEYNLIYSGKKDIEDEKKEKLSSELNNNKSNIVIDSFYMKKELDETYKLISNVLLKLEKLLSGESGIELDNEQKDKLKIIYNSIIKFKKTTNISKLKEIGELALLKIGKIELDDAENKHKENSEQLLKDTNSLLKKIGSKESFTKKENDIGYILSSFFNKFKNIYLYFKNTKNNVEIIDKNTHSYIKNMLFLKKYREKLKENNIYILKNLPILLFSSEKRLDILIRRKVIIQNITLFKAKENGIGFSYTTVKKGFAKFIDYILELIRTLRIYLFLVIFIYTILFIVYLNINYYSGNIDSNYDGIFYFLILFLVYIVLYFTRNFILIILNFVILFFIIIFGVVNF